MTMKPFILALAIASTATIPQALAQTWQWKDSSGRTVISDSPPPGSIRPSRMISPPPPSEKPQAAEAPKSLAEQDMEFKKRQQANKEKTEKDNKENASKTEAKDNCERARQHLAALESGQRIPGFDVNGERRFMEDAERQRETASIRKFLADSCK